MPLLTRKRVLAAKIETTPGTAISVGVDDAVFNVFNATMQPTIEFVERTKQGQFSRQTSIGGARMGTCTFSTHIYGDGEAGVPDWASVFFPACGFTESFQVFTPKTDDLGTTVKSLTLALYEDGLIKTLAGAVGTARFVFTAGQPVVIEWTFTGKWVAPADGAILAPTYDTALPHRWASSTTTLGGSAIQLSSMTIDMGNNVVMREDPSDASGYTTGLVTDRVVSGSMDPESPLVAGNDTYGKWLAGTEEALSVNLDDGTDDITIAAPKVQRINLQEGDRNGIQIDQIDFQCNASAAAGNDELSITFA
jgi:hypothetical protein